MYKGFYNLTSAMLTHQHNLNVIGNNMVNISTAGYKQERYVASTFDDVMYSQVDVNHSSGREIGRQSYIRAASDVYTDYSQGIPEPTDLPLDFAIVGEGFFAVQNPEGEVAYTRMGNFSLDEEGYLCLPGFGQVLDPQNQPIYLGTDKIRGDRQGIIYYDGDTAIGQLGIFRFEDNEALERNDRGLFLGENAQASEDFEIWNGYLERSNSDMVKQMTEMITYQRALQSAAQLSKMYDQVMGQATREVGGF
ncbi:flagellar hook-basal body protein [Oscillospiraceae bacterium 38-13]|jgi:flagellar basal-body rod protein FlgG